MSPETANPVRPRSFDLASFFIGGAWVRDESRSVIPVIKPATEEIAGEVQLATIADAEAAVAAAGNVFRAGHWAELTFAERAQYLSRLADLIEENRPEFYHYYLEFEANVSNPHVLSVAIDVLREWVRIGEEYDAEPERRQDAAGNPLLVSRLPVGPVFASVPWNSPLILAVLKIGAPLLAGCPVVLKTDPQTPFSGLLLAKLIAGLDLPAGVFSHMVAGPDVGQYLVSHPGIAHITFTGSTNVGRQIARSASENFTRVTLELGGKSAGILLADVDPVDVLPQLFGACLGHAGQTCTTSSRLLVPDSRYDEWAKALAGAFSSYIVGDPADPASQIPPLISAAHRDRVERLVTSARAEGATILAGGRRPPHLTRGYFYEPTLIADVRSDMTVVREEVFGPVITLQPYRGEEEAIQIANDTVYGLANAIFTRDVSHAIELSRRLRSGTVSINRGGCCLTQPFGGMGYSGIGREGGREGLEEFLELQQVLVPAEPLAT
jgi:aldehyde dehydrogenase (NAD+)